MDIKNADSAGLRLGDEVTAAIDAEARQQYPHEACGLLVGRGLPHATLIERAVPARNLAVERLQDRYVLDPDDFRAADEEARRAGLDIVGIWHSHPDHPARPSVTDLEAAWPGYSYLIVSVSEAGVQERRAWRLDGDEFIEQTIEIPASAIPAGRSRGGQSTGIPGSSNEEQTS